MKFILNYKKKKFSLDVVNCSLLGRFRGLMFRRRETAPILLFDFGKKTRISLHSFFVFFPFVAVWLDAEDNVVDVQFVNSVRACIKPKKSFVKVVEIPLNDKYSDVCKSLVED